MDTVAACYVIGSLVVIVAFWVRWIIVEEQVRREDEQNW